MKKIYLLVAMIALTALNTFAQKIYTGSIVFLEKGYKVQVDDEKKSIEAKAFLNKFVSIVYGQNWYSKMKIEPSTNEIIVKRVTDLDVMDVADVAKNEKKLGDYYIGVLSSYTHAATMINEFVFNSKTNTLYQVGNSYTKKMKPRKITI